MNLEIKAKWLEGLRSGKYQQGERYLRHRKTVNGTCSDYWCCLGVLCDILAPEKWGNTSGRDVIVSHEGHQGYPAKHLAERAGLQPDVFSQLARLNDHGTPFAEIAAMIERDL